MFPQYFPYASDSANGTSSTLSLPLVNFLSRTPNMHPLNLSQSGLAQFGIANPSGACSASTLSETDLRNHLASLLLSQNGISQAGISPVGEIGLPGTYSLPSSLIAITPNNPLLPRLDTVGAISHILPFLSSVGSRQIQTVSGYATIPDADNLDSHTIVRAPVLYKTTRQSDLTEIESNIRSSVLKAKRGEGNSPPDRIVASYAVAARAAAIACQQPLSSAAEVFLLSSSRNAVTTNSKLRLRRSRANRAQTSQEGLSMVSVSVPALTCQVNTCEESSNEASISKRWASEWTRIVDRRTNTVVYIAPDGVQFRCLDDIRKHLKERSSESQSAISNSLISSNFCFDSSKDSCMVPPPDDKVFADLLSVSGPVLPSNCFGENIIKRPNVVAGHEEMSKRQRTESDSSAHSLQFPMTSSTSDNNTNFFQPLTSVSASDESFIHSCLSSSEVLTSTIFTENACAVNIVSGANPKPSARVTLSTQIHFPATESLSSLSLSFLQPGLGDSVTQSQENVPKITNENLTTHTFVSRGTSSDSGPSIISSVLPPSLSSPTGNNVLNSDLASLLSGSLLCHAPDLIGQYQQQLVAASQLSEVVRLNQLQQISARSNMPFIPSSWQLFSTNQAPVPCSFQTALLQQQVSAVAQQYHRQQEAALLLIQQQQRQQTQLQSLQTYAALFQRAQQFSLDQIATLNNLSQ